MQRCRWRLDAWRRALAALTVVCCVGDAAGNSVYVVGYNDYGQLGLGDYLERSTQTLMHDIPLDKTVSVAAGLYHNLVVGEEGGQRGTMYTWGRNTKGQLGHGNVESISLPKRVEWTPCMKPNSWVCSPSLCEKDVCQPHPCQFFGTKNPYYKERDMHCMKPQDVVWGDQPYPNIIEVAAGEDSSYALTEEGRIFAWGSNDWGQLGISDEQEEPLARPDGKYLRDVPMLLRSVLSQRFASLAAGTFHCAALEDTGQVWVWGANSEGQLGVGDLAQRAQPARVIFLEGVNVVRVATGAYHTLFLTDFGELFSTGLNANGQLGHGDDVSRRLPSQVQALRAANISNVACGAYASYAVTAAGEVYAWGSNSFGQLGLGPAEAAIVPLPKVVQWLRAQRAVIYELFGGQRTVFAMEQSGKVYAIGNNEFGMLALGDETTRNIPATLADLVGKNVFRVAAGAYHSLFVTGCQELASPCSGHGQCDVLNNCVCAAGYRGPICGDECPGGVGNACSLRGDCIIPKGAPPFCICYDGYSGADCSIECPGGALNPCSGQGECLGDGQCSCASGWSGRNCSQRCPGAMSSPCSDLGLCVDGECKCYHGFTGTNCSTECSGGAYNPCTLNGDCQMDGSCRCYKGFRLADCSCECPGGVDYICHDRGHCNEQCMCDCRLGYRGQNCSIDCPGGLKSYMDGFPVIFRVCHGNGECDRQGKCQCYAGYTGDACENAPPDLGPLLLGFVVFVLGVCCCCSAYVYYLRRKMRFSERERKRKARKKLRANKKGKGGKGGKGGGKDKNRDRGKKKGKINK